MEKTVLDWIALVLVIIGGLNWGFFAIDPSWNLVELIFGAIPILAKIVYALVALSAVYMIYMAFKK